MDSRRERGLYAYCRVKMVPVMCRQRDTGGGKSHRWTKPTGTLHNEFLDIGSDIFENPWATQDASSKERENVAKYPLRSSPDNEKQKISLQDS